MTFTDKQIENYKKAGEIARQVKEYAREIIKKDMLLVEIAQKIEGKIVELGGRIAFPVNLCINEVAAHYTPRLGDEEKAYGLLKIDLGVSVKGFIADTAFSIDLEDSKENKELIEASQEALSGAIDFIKEGVKLREIGKVIQERINDKGFASIRNLSGHELGKGKVHAGLTIPNYDNGNENQLEDGAYAIEPFATTGEGVVKDGGKSNIYRIENPGNARDSLAREIISYVIDEYGTLPFSERVVEEKFGSRTRIALGFLENAGILHHYAQLVEKSKGKVSQAEQTVLIFSGKKEITTK